MFGLNKISAAVGRLVASLNALSTSLTEVNDGLRSTLKLDAPARKALAGPEEGNGKVARKGKEVAT